MAHHGEIKMLTEVVGQGEVQVCLTTAQVHKHIRPAVLVAPSSSPLPNPGASAAELGRKLLAAAGAGDNAHVRELIAQGAPFVSDWLGVSPLHVAANAGHTDVVQSLVSAGMSRDVRTKVERSALHMAAAAGHAAVVRVLLDAGAPADCRDLLRMTPLHWAAARGRLAAARELCRAGACPRSVSRFLQTPLQMALRNHPELHELHSVLRQREKEVDDAEAEAELDDGEEADEDNETMEEQTVTVEEHERAERAVPRPRAAAALLRAHGITLLPEDEGSTVLTAIQSGRTVVLSDAGKIMLKESSERRTATAQKLAHVKYVQLPKDAKIIPMTPPSAGFTARRALEPPRKGKPRAVKILLNKNHLGKLVAAAGNASLVNTKVAMATAAGPSHHSANVTNTKVATAAGPSVVVTGSSGSISTATGPMSTVTRPGGSVVASSAAPSHVVRVPEQFLQSTDPEYLRRQLLAAHAGLARLKHQLKTLRSNT